MVSGYTPVLNWARVNARINSEFLREVIAEFLGTFILCLFAVGGTCQVAIFGFHKDFDTSNASVIATAFGYFIANLLFGSVSGAHVNPAISVGYSIVGKLSWIKLHGFVLAQFCGGYLGSLLAYGLYNSYVEKLIRGNNAQKIPDMAYSAGLFLANPGVIPVGAGFANEIVITGIFMMCILAVMDSWNTRTPRCFQGIIIGLVVIGLGFGFGRMTGVMLNPARDICPRLAALTLGWSSDAATKGDLGSQWWSVGFFGPFIGAILGSLIYIFVIGAQLSQYPTHVENTVDENYVEVQTPQDWRSTVFIPKPQTGRASPHVKVQFAE